MNRCLHCYEVLEKTEEVELEFHQKCSRSFFNHPSPPRLDLDKKQLTQYAEKSIHSQRTLTGVQPKLSLGFSKNIDQANRLTILGVNGNYILKPATKNFKDLPEIESLTMHLAQEIKINTVPHSLIRLASGELSYITRRIDRTQDGKIPMEDFCQLSERLTEDKYRGSYEQCAKIISKYSTNKGLDLVNFYEVILFSFLTGNADMHLKNFSLILNKHNLYHLAPNYDLVATKLLIPEDKEELALTLNAKKSNLKRKDFYIAMTKSQISEKVQHFLFKKIEKALVPWENKIKQSFLKEDRKIEYNELIRERWDRIKN